MSAVAWVLLAGVASGRSPGWADDDRISRRQILGLPIGPRTSAPRRLPSDGNDASCAAAFVLEGDIVGYAPRDVRISHRTTFLRVTSAIKGTTPDEVPLVVFLNTFPNVGGPLRPGDHVVVFGDLFTTRAGAQEIALTRKALVRDGDIAREPIETTVRMLGATEPLPPPTLTVYASWSPDLLRVYEGVNPTVGDPETGYSRLFDVVFARDARALGAPWAEIVRQIRDAPHSAPECTPPGEFPE